MNKNILVKDSSIQTKHFSTAMITPTIAVLAVMTAYPLIFTVFYSFSDYNLLKTLNGSAEMIGAANYIELLTDPYFQQSVWNTVKFTVLTVAFEMLVGLIMALFVNTLKKGQKIMRILLLLPYLLPTVTVALIWRMMLSPIIKFSPAHMLPVRRAAVLYAYFLKPSFRLTARLKTRAPGLESLLSAQK